MLLQWDKAVKIGKEAIPVRKALRRFYSSTAESKNHLFFFLFLLRIKTETGPALRPGAKNFAEL
jgi:hypothetical protein